MQFIRWDDRIECPICDSPLTLVREWDKRLALMRHEGRTTCRYYWKQYRIDRLTGYGEETENATKPTEVRIQTHGVAP